MNPLSLKFWRFASDSDELKLSNSSLRSHFLGSTVDCIQGNHDPFETTSRHPSVALCLAGLLAPSRGCMAIRKAHLSTKSQDEGMEH